MDAKNLEGAETILEMFFDSVLVLSVQKGFLGTILEVVLFDPGWPGWCWVFLLILIADVSSTM